MGFIKGRHVKAVLSSIVALANKDCWNDFYNEKFCCECGWRECWTSVYSPEACCSEASLGKARWNFNSTVSELLCKPAVAKCLDNHIATSSPDCIDLIHYVKTLSYDCWQTIRSILSCQSGIVVATWALERNRPFFQPDVKYDSQQCVTSLVQLRTMSMYVPHMEEAGHWHGPDKGWLEYDRDRHAMRCAFRRAEELRKLLPEARQAFYSQQGQEKIKQEEKRDLVGNSTHPKIGVIIAIAPHELDFYRRTVDLWRCYCAFHGDCDVIFETKDFLPWYQYPKVQVVDPDTGHPENKVVKTWNRWLALRDHLTSYDWVFTADPDQFFSRECFSSLSLTEVLRRSGGIATSNNTKKHLNLPLPSVIMRDFALFQTLNSASVFFRNCAASKLFLTLLFQKIKWGVLLDFDQSAFDQTVLEFIDLWVNSAKAVRSRNANFQSVACLGEQFSSRNQLLPYLQCWHRFMDKRVGTFANRARDSPLFLLDPQKVDINYVLGGRTHDDAPLVWHIAGKDKHHVHDSNNTVHHRQGDTFFYGLMKTLWNVLELPEGAGLQEKPDCAAWEAHTSGLTCDPGTKLVDCRKELLAIC